MLGLFVFLAVSKPEPITIERWTIVVEDAVADDAHWPAAKSELTRQLQDIKRIVPDEPLTKLQRVKIWVHAKSKITQCMAYHPSAAWLKEHGADPAMARGVDIGSVENFASWTYEQPWMVMHELAHAYHDQFLDKGFENEAVKSVFAKAMEGKKYESILHWNGSMTKHYATSNQMEFFAETTESYFGTNDMYPFVRAELMGFDPEAFQLMEKIWGKPVKRMLE